MLIKELFNNKYKHLNVLKETVQEKYDFDFGVLKDFANIPQLLEHHQTCKDNIVKNSTFNSYHTDEHYIKHNTIIEMLKLVQTLNEATTEKYYVVRKGGSVGSKDSLGEPYASKEAASEKAKRLNKSLSPGEKGYYGIKYVVKTVNEAEVVPFKQPEHDTDQVKSSSNAYAIGKALLDIGKILPSGYAQSNFYKMAEKAFGADVSKELYWMFNPYENDEYPSTEQSERAEAANNIEKGLRDKKPATLFIIKNMNRIEDLAKKVVAGDNTKLIKEAVPGTVDRTVGQLEDMAIKLVKSGKFNTHSEAAEHAFSKNEQNIAKHVNPDIVYRELMGVIASKIKRGVFKDATTKNPTNEGTTNMTNDITKSIKESMELDKAEIVLAVQSMGDELQKTIEKLSKMQVEDLLPVVERIKAEYGIDFAVSVEQAINSALSMAVESVKQSKDAVDNEALKLSGEVPMNTMDTEPEAPAEELPVEEPSDEFGGTDTASGPEEEPLGRAKKESIGENASSGSTCAGNIAQIPMPIGTVKRRVEKKDESVVEAAGDTIEAHGIKGMARTKWYKTFKNRAALDAWADKFDATVHGTRDIASAKKGSLNPAIKEAVLPIIDKIVNQLEPMVEKLVADGRFERHFDAMTYLLNKNKDKISKQANIEVVQRVLIQRINHRLETGLLKEIDKGDTATYKGHKVNVAVPNGPGNLVGVTTNAKVKMVPSKDLKEAEYNFNKKDEEVETEVEEKEEVANEEPKGNPFAKKADAKAPTDTKAPAAKATGSKDNYLLGEPAKGASVEIKQSEVNPMLDVVGTPNAGGETPTLESQINELEGLIGNGTIVDPKDPRAKQLANLYMKQDEACKMSKKKVGEGSSCQVIGNSTDNDAEKRKKNIDNLIGKGYVFATMDRSIPGARPYYSKTKEEAKDLEELMKEPETMSLKDLY